MREVENALVNIQNALENDTEVSVAGIERLESVLNQSTRYYMAMLNLTDETEQNAEKLLATKQEFKQLIADLDDVEKSVESYEAYARELDEWASELEIKALRIKP